MSFVPRRAAVVVVVGLLAAPALLPLLTAVASWATPAGEVWQHQLQHVLPRVAWNTTLLLLIVGSATAMLGTGLAWLVAGHDFPGRSMFTWALLLPLAVPGYVLAVVFAGALDFTGPLQSWLRAATLSPLRLPPIRSLGGAALVLTLCLYPYVYMLARVAFESAGARALEAAQSLGLDRRAAFRKVLLPLARPAVAAGVGLVCMETLADFGVVATLNVDTFTTAIYRAWFGMFSISRRAADGGAARPVRARRRVTRATIARPTRFRRAAPQRRPASAETVRRPRSRCLMAAALVLLLAFALPMAQLLAWSIAHAASDLDARYWAFAARSVAVAASGALVVVTVALVLGYALRRESRPWVRGLGRFATVGYAIPGTVLAVGLFAPVAALDGWLQSGLDCLFGATSPQLFLQGTLLVMFIAYLVRFLAVGFGPIDSGLHRIHPQRRRSRRNLGTRGIRGCVAYTSRCCAPACWPLRRLCSSTS